MPVEPTAVNHGRAIEGGYVVGGEQTGQEIADEATDSVDGKDVERIVNVKQELELGGIIAGDGSDDSEDDGGPRWDEAGAGSDGDETGNDTTAETDGGPLALEPVVEDTPGQATNAGSNVGDDGSHDRSEVSREGTAGIEAKPSGERVSTDDEREYGFNYLPNPQKDGSEDDVGDIVGTVVQFVSTVTATFSEHQRVGQSGGARGNVDRGATSKVKTTHVEGPAGAVPGPASNGIVDDGGPDEGEDHGGQDATTLGGSTDGEGNGDGGEHALVNGKHEIRNLAGSDRGGTENIAETNVAQVTDELAGGVREGEGIAPEEPLEGNEAGGGNGKPNE